MASAPEQRLHYHTQYDVNASSFSTQSITINIFHITFYFAVLKHTQAVNSFRRKWRRRIAFNSSTNETLNEERAVPADCTDKAMCKPVDEARTEEATRTPTSATSQSASERLGSHPWRPLGRSSSVATLGHCQRVDLFLAGITHYITYSDQLRDLSFEVYSADGNSLVIQCASQEICHQWISAIKSTIDRLSEDFVSFSIDVLYCLLPLATNPFILLIFEPLNDVFFTLLDVILQ